MNVTFKGDLNWKPKILLVISLFCFLYLYISLFKNLYFQSFKMSIWQSNLFDVFLETLGIYRKKHTHRIDFFTSVKLNVSIIDYNSCNSLLHDDWVRWTFWDCVDKRKQFNSIHWKSQRLSLKNRQPRNFQWYFACITLTFIYRIFSLALELRTPNDTYTHNE